MKGDPQTHCVGNTKSGDACKAPVVPGTDRCKWHPTTDEGREQLRDEARRGGLTKAYGALASGPPIADSEAVDGLNLESAAGLRALIGHTLKALSRLPFDTRTATAIGQLATTQRAVLETTELERRLGDLEAELKERTLRRA